MLELKTELVTHQKVCLVTSRKKTQKKHAEGKLKIGKRIIDC